MRPSSPESDPPDAAPSGAEREASRRAFLRRLGLAAGVGAALAWPERIRALEWACSVGPSAPRGPAGDAQDPWRPVRAEFLIPEDRLYFNVGTLGPQPRVVLDAVCEHMRRVAMTFPPAVDWDALKARLAAVVHCDPAGLVFPRNTTEGMNFVAAGLDLRPGDEVLTTDHEHIGGLCCWQLQARRRGVVLRQLRLPVPPSDAGEVVDIFRKAMTRRTRVVSISHVNFTNGLLMPVAEIVALCRRRGVIVVVDGAHPPGLIPVDIAALDPDFYASSPHKWLLAAQGTGFLYMREEWRTRLWPTLASGDWDDTSLGAQRFNHLGTFDESRLAGLLAAIAFHEAVGAERVYARIRELRRRLADGLADLRGVRVISPADERMVAGMVSFALERIPALELQKRLAERANARTRVIGEYGYGWMRLSPHIYNSPAEIDRLLALIGEAAA
ncbi:MAG: aminotransferase class V-fold PLP-dependent enzyme [Gemmatimonadetes bacterium]|nr:aminotransferase class V-fold PLP-dependent enzyme [Gemmatimonadota bacterium]